jgi:hypothetical protein
MGGLVAADPSTVRGKNSTHQENSATGEASPAIIRASVFTSLKLLDVSFFSTKIAHQDSKQELDDTLGDEKTSAAQRSMLFLDARTCFLSVHLGTGFLKAGIFRAALETEELFSFLMYVHEAENSLIQKKHYRCTTKLCVSCDPFC